MHLGVLCFSRVITFVTLALAKVVKHGHLLHCSKLLDSQRALAATECHSTTFAAVRTSYELPSPGSSGVNSDISSCLFENLKF